jgi:hypothetical protein
MENLTLDRLAGIIAFARVASLEVTPRPHEPCQYHLQRLVRA